MSDNVNVLENVFWKKEKKTIVSVILRIISIQSAFVIVHTNKWKVIYKLRVPYYQKYGKMEKFITKIKIRFFYDIKLIYQSKDIKIINIYQCYQCYH